MKDLFQFLVAICAIAFASGAAGQTPFFKYRIDSVSAQLLPNTFGGDESVATDVNDYGVVVGWARMSAGIPHAFSHYAGVTTDVGASQGLLPSWAHGVNNYGEVVGLYWDVGNDRAFYWHSNAGFVVLNNNVHPGEGIDHEYGTSALAINDSGRIAGRAYGMSFPSPIPYADCYWDISIHWPYAYAAPELPYCPHQPYGNNAAFDISNSGWLVGGEQDTSHRGFKWKDGVLIYVPKPPAAGNAEIHIHGVNDGGVVVGRAITNAGGQAILWNGVTANSQYLGILPGGNDSVAMKINEGGFVAGHSERLLQLHLGKRDRAFLWHTDFGMYELPVPSAIPDGLSAHCKANSLNARSSAGLIQVVGYCTQSGKKKAVRWVVATTRRSYIPSL